MFGVWLAIAVLMVLAHRSHNTSVVALILQFVVNPEMFVGRGDGVAADRRLSGGVRDRVAGAR